jgi:pyrimidine-nucleoside phosphorylase
MRACDIILKKRNGETLTSDEIEFIVGQYALRMIPDAQMAAWLMAVWFRGMTIEETAALTMAMVHSGQTLDLSCIPGVKVDKHSTGGVGDKTTLVLVPLLAAAGVPVAKMSGRSLGHTGGTLDKLESIPGFTTALAPEEIVSQVKRTGAAIAGQTATLVPADKKIYALRDITGTVDSIPLIAASVMSKKIAAGSDAILLDVKTGSGAFMRTLTGSGRLARAMVEIGRQVGRRTVAAITDMEQPLGRAVGNSLEVAETIRTLHGEGPDDLVELCVALGGIALVLGGKASRREQGERMIRKLLASGEGAAKFRQIIKAQGGSPAVMDDLSLLPQAPVVSPALARRKSVVRHLDAFQIAQAACLLGAGRGSPRAVPDLSVGVYLHKKMGDPVARGEPVAEVHARTEASARKASKIVQSAYTFGLEPPEPRPLIHEVIGL